MIEFRQQARNYRFFRLAGYLPLVFILVSCHVLLAQVDIGAVVGTVTDPTKAVMPQAIVTLLQEHTNVKQTALSGRNGEYTFRRKRMSGFGRVRCIRSGGLQATQQYGVSGIPQTSENGDLPGFAVGNIDFGSASTLPSDKASDTLQASDNLTIDTGSNQLRVGFEYLNIAYREDSNLLSGTGCAAPAVAPLSLASRMAPSGMMP